MNTRILVGICDWFRQRSGVLAISAGVTLGLAQPFSVSGIAIASGSLDLNSFSLTPGSGSIVWSGPWMLSTFVSVDNSDGGVDFQFETGATSASASASVPYASANSSANFPAAAGKFGRVDGTVNLPAGVNAAASVVASQSTFENLFAITGVSGFVDVSFNAVLSSILMATTDAAGISASADNIFNLNVDGAPVLSFFDLATVGPNGSASSSLNPTLAATISLDSSIEHHVFLSLDPEINGNTTAVPEPGETWLLLLFGLGPVALAGSFLGKAEKMQQST